MKNIIYNKELKETIHFRKTSAETAGLYSELEISLEPRGGNPLHYHTAYSELFTAVEGRLGMELQGGKEILLQPGDSYLVRKGEIHRFFNPDNQPITFTNRVEPGSTGLEDTLRILCGLAGDGLYSKNNIPRNPIHLAVCGKMSDMRLPGWKGKITGPFINLLSWVAGKSGMKQKLVDKYCV
ncbi:cupin domain-containing protein [Pedobacter sp. KLB.chiD]|uniref:cupin domain-containing protein n=1 Tax=Pedobacter sp. KLB.chiD TaxID=3387402 RepID=UPI00399AB4FA